MFNLMPKPEKILIRGRYNRRLLSVMFLAAGVSAVFAVLLAAPSYILSLSKNNLAEQNLKKLDNPTDAKEAKDFQTLVETTKKKTDILSAEKSETSFAKIADKVSRLLPAGVSIFSFSFQPDGKGGGKLAMEGKSKARTNLMIFARALEKETNFSGIDLPVSNFAKESDIDFSINLNVKQ